jgi:hypothetical protein
MINFLEIIDAWKIAHNPTPKQEELAKLRFDICNICPFKKVVTNKLKIATICEECGCPISKKIFSPKFNACPLSKWGEVDNIYIPNKNTSSLI